MNKNAVLDECGLHICGSPETKTSNDTNVATTDNVSRGISLWSISCDDTSYDMLNENISVIHNTETKCDVVRVISRFFDRVRFRIADYFFGPIYH